MLENIIQNINLNLDLSMSRCVDTSVCILSTVLTHELYPLTKISSWSQRELSQSARRRREFLGYLAPIQRGLSQLARRRREKFGGI